MPISDAEVAQWFRKAWAENTHTAPWRDCIGDLSASQALWKPEGLPLKRCIWDLVRHMAFWRELYLRELGGETRTNEEVERRNWELIEDQSDDAWQGELDRFRESQDRLVEAIEASPHDVMRLASFIEHDSYHFGQIMVLRALQGMPPVDSY